MPSKMSRFFIASLTMQDITRHRRLLNYFQLYYRHSGFINEHSPLSLAILHSLPPLSFVPAFIQIWTGCRYNEIFQVPIDAIKTNSSFTIQSSKSKYKKEIPALKLYKPNQLRSLDPRTSVSVCSYDKYKEDIRKCKIHLDIQLPKNILDCTHIFRHIEASFYNSRGRDLKYISDYLGHGSDKTTLSYIHDMKDFFPKQTKKKR